MTASAEQTPAQNTAQTASVPEAGALSRRSPGLLLGGIALLLLAAGGGFMLWRTLAGRDQTDMQGPPAFPVEIERLALEPLENSADYVGTLDAQAGVSLQPEADGRVVQIFVTEGESVQAGDPVVQLSAGRSQSDYNAALASISAAQSARDTVRAQLRAAQKRQRELLADLELQENDYRRTAVLVERGALPQEQLDQVSRDRTVADSALQSAAEEIAALTASVDQAEATLAQAQANASATQQDLLDKTVSAPISGIVGDIPIKLGDYVTAGSALATITQNQGLDLNVSVPINEAERLRTGLPVELRLFGQEQVIATGNIRFVSPTADSATQTLLAKARFSTPTVPIQDNQRLQVRVIWAQRPGLLIPTTAVSRLGGQTFVYIPAQPESTPPSGSGNSSPDSPSLVARQIPVKLGPLQGNEYQVLEGLKPGDQVITSGLLNLRDGVPIQRAPAADGPPTQPQS